jgi:hypothetical protein
VSKAKTLPLLNAFLSGGLPSAKLLWQVLLNKYVGKRDEGLTGLAGLSKFSFSQASFRACRYFFEASFTGQARRGWTKAFPQKTNLK